MVFVLFVSLIAGIYCYFSLSVALKVIFILFGGLLGVLLVKFVKKSICWGWLFLFFSGFLAVFSVFPLSKHVNLKEIQGKVLDVRPGKKGQTIIIKSGSYKLWLYQKKPVALKPGYVVWVKGKFKPITRRDYFFSERYTHRGFIWKLKIISEQVESPQGIVSLLSQFFKKSEYSYLYQGFLIGKRKTIPREVLKLFKDSGTMHLMAISGLHVGIITFFLMFMMGLFPLSPKWKLFGVNVILISYLILLNFPASATRAIVFTSTLSAALLLERRASLSDILFLSGALIVLINPRIVFSLGFQLSFMATLGILRALPLVQKAGDKIKFKGWSYLIQGLMVGFFAQLFIIPFLLYHFKSFNFLSLFLTIPLGLLLTGMIYWSLAGFFLFMFWPWLGELLLNASDLLAWLMLKFLKAVDGFDLLRIQGNFPLWLWPLYYGIIVFLMQGLYKKYQLEPALMN